MTSPARPVVRRHLVDNKAGWRLALTRHYVVGEPRGRPVLIVPGSGMNAFLFHFHPNGPSLVETLAARGLDVWTVDLRGQGRSIRARGSHRYGLADLAVEDLGAAIDFVLETTGAPKLDLVGCSLGAALAFGHVVLRPEAPVHALVSMAGLVTWRDAHPLVRVAFASRRIAGMMRMKNTRRLARFALPALSRVAPSLLSLYLNARSTDLTQLARLVQAVEDPHPIVNREIADWLRIGDLVLRNINVSARLKGLQHPFLCVVANNDGIVPPRTARWTYDVIGSPVKELLCVGDAAHPIAHGDLFVSRDAQTKVFGPVADFLLRV